MERTLGGRYLCAFIRDLTGSIGNIWRRWYLERGLGELPGTRIQNIGEPCGWHERKQARRRGTNAKEEARFLRGESGSIRLPGQPSPRLTHPVPANHEIFCAYMSSLLLIANCKYVRGSIRIIDTGHTRMRNACVAIDCAMYVRHIMSKCLRRE